MINSYNVREIKKAGFGTTLALSPDYVHSRETAHHSHVLK